MQTFSHVIQGLNFTILLYWWSPYHVVWNNQYINILFVHKHLPERAKKYFPNLSFAMSSLHLVLIFTRYIQSSFSSYIHSSFHFLKAIFLLLSSVLTRAEPYKLQFFIEDWENGNYPLLSFFFSPLSLSLSFSFLMDFKINSHATNEIQCLISCSV